MKRINKRALYGNIPQELRDRDQWVCFKILPGRIGRTRKIPIDPKTGRYASVTNRSTWSSFEAALKGCDKYGLSGVGFVFTETDPFTGIDLDHCRNPKTGDIKRWAMRIIVRLRGYAEVSLSGTGVKVFVTGKIPGPVKSKHFEMYSTKRFFAVTGLALEGVSSHIGKDRTRILGEFHRKFKTSAVQKASDKGLKRMMSTVARNARSFSGSDRISKFGRLFAGDWSAYPSHSEADLALCGMLAYLTNGSPGSMDSLFRESGLYREKWDRPFSDGTTYGQLTIRKAIRGMRTNSVDKRGC